MLYIEQYYINGLVRDWCNSSASTMELLQSGRLVLSHWYNTKIVETDLGEKFDFAMNFSASCWNGYDTTGMIFFSCIVLADLYIERHKSME